MSAKDSQPIPEKKNHFLEIYQRNYLESPTTSSASRSKT